MQGQGGVASGLGIFEPHKTLIIIISPLVHWFPLCAFHHPINNVEHMINEQFLCPTEVYLLSEWSWEYQRITVDKSKTHTSYEFPWEALRDRESEKEWKRVWQLWWWTFPQFHLAAAEGSSATAGPWDLVLSGAGRAYGLWSWVCVCVRMCVWRDSCPAHLPPLRLASFIINPDDQVAMSLCPCQGMLRTDLWTSIRHSSAHVYCSCTAWLTRHPGPGFETVSCGYIMTNHTWQSTGVCMLSVWIPMKPQISAVTGDLTGVWPTV